MFLGRVGSTGMEIARVLGGGLAPGMSLLYIAIEPQVHKNHLQKFTGGHHYFS